MHYTYMVSMHNEMINTIFCSLVYLINLLQLQKEIKFLLEVN